jgi:hypothetical protein
MRDGWRAPYSEIVLRYGPERRVQILLGADCPAKLAALAGRTFGPDGVLAPEAFERFDAFYEQARRLEPELRCADDAMAFIAEVRDGVQRRQRLAAAFPRGIRSAAFGKLLKTKLYDYQREGALFAARAGRCLIGDEMGLGKTVQAIAAAEILARHAGASRALVVCPTSLKHQWEREIERFSTRGATVIGGGALRRRELFAEESFFKIANYDNVARDLALIAAWSPELVILDEAQRIKNWATRTARCVKAIESPYAIVLTGTPLENRLEELVSIMDFVDRHRLGPMFRIREAHETLDERGRVVGYRNLDAIGRTLAPVLLRRRKKDVLTQLPPRMEKTYFVPMTPQQMALHAENAELVGRIAQKWKRFRFLSEADRHRLMAALQNMRMSCDSTFLLDPMTEFGVKADELATLAAEACERPETKIVVFSQWLRMHELLHRRLEAKGIGHVLFHGGVPSEERGELIRRFREEPACRVFLSTDAGGVGLNLQHASMVVNMDLPWNPAVLEQRIGRVHRLGQRQPVLVVNFVAQGSIEEGMLSVIAFKRSLFAGVLDGGDTDVFQSASRLQRFMETVEAATTAIPAQVVEETTSSDTEPGGRAERAAGVPDARDAGDAGAPGATRSPGAESESLGEGDGASESAESDPPRATTAPAMQENPTGGAAPSHPTPLETLGVALESLLRLVQGVAQEGTTAATAGAAAGGRAGATSGDPLLRRDPITGTPYLHLPVPDADVLASAVSALGALVGQLRGGRGGGVGGGGGRS